MTKIEEVEERLRKSMKQFRDSGGFVAPWWSLYVENEYFKLGKELYKSAKERGAFCK